MALRNLAFSDLILFENGVAKLKGHEQRLVPVPLECAAEAQGLKNYVIENVTKDSVRIEYEGARYRVSRIQDVTLGNSWFLRRLADEIPDFTKLGPVTGSGSGRFAAVAGWLLAPEQNHGLVLISGSQASGKTTFASAYTVARLMKYGGHAVTFENPPELPLSGDWGDGGFCFQTEISSEEELGLQIERANRYGLPNINFVGEIRNRRVAQEAMRLGLGSSRQIVVATTYGLNVVATLQRLMNWCKESDGDNAYDSLAMSLLAVIQLTLEAEDGRLATKIPEFLLLPFNNGSRVSAIRAKLRINNLNGLRDDMTEQNNIIKSSGMDGL